VTRTVNRTPSLARAVLVTPGQTVINTETRPVAYPEFDLGLGHFVTRMRHMFGSAPDGTVLVDAGAAAALGLPQTAPQTAPDHPSLVAARGEGWKVSDLAPWTTFHRKGWPAVHLGVLPWLQAQDAHGLARIAAGEKGRLRFPLQLDAASPADIVTRLYRWTVLTGAAYHGTPGVAGTALLRKLQEGTRFEPTWMPGNLDAYREYRSCELDWSARHWSRPPAAGVRWEHGYDANLMYLAAAASAVLPLRSLRHTGRRPFDKRLAGYWRVELSPWLDTLLPDPAGYGPGHRDGGPRRLATPTLALLQDLTDEGVYGGFSVLDSWTCGERTNPKMPVTGLPLQPWAHVIRDAIALMSAIQDAGTAVDLAEPVALLLALSRTYKETIGSFVRGTGLVRRPEWQSIICALARAVLWRKIRTVGRESGRWPLRIETDCVWYEGATADSVADMPAGLIEGRGPGKCDRRKFKTNRLEVVA